jgi:predicted transcriptional regulator of viral defense system
VAADPAALRRALNAIAVAQLGFFTARQALQVGYSYPAQKYHVDRGSWQRVGRGLFRLPDWPNSDIDQFVRLRLWSEDRAVVSHDSALALHDLGDANPARIHLTVPRGFRAQDPSVVLHNAELDPADIEDRTQFNVTTVDRTLLDVAAGDISQELLNGAVADAVAQGATTPRRLRHRADEFGDRAALRMERALEAADETH